MIVLDTDLLIALLAREKRIMEATKQWHAEGEGLATTSINMAELLRGLRGRKLTDGRRLIAGLTIVPFGPRAASRFGRFMEALDRAGRPAPVVDAMIAAATMEAGARLASYNHKDFQRIPGLELETP